jgi:hypothetical protein
MMTTAVLTLRGRIARDRDEVGVAAGFEHADIRSGPAAGSCRPGQRAWHRPRGGIAGAADGLASMRAAVITVAGCAGAESCCAWLAPLIAARPDSSSVERVKACGTTGFP